MISGVSRHQLAGSRGAGGPSFPFLAARALSVSLRLLTSAEIFLKQHSNVFPVLTKKGCFGAPNRIVVRGSGRGTPARGKEDGEEAPWAGAGAGALGLRTRLAHPGQQGDGNGERGAEIAGCSSEDLVVSPSATASRRRAAPVPALPLLRDPFLHTSR